MKINGDDAAFGEIDTETHYGDMGIPFLRTHSIVSGLNKREIFAMCAMQGLTSPQDVLPRDADVTCYKAVEFADALIKTLNGE